MAGPLAEWLTHSLRHNGAQKAGIDRAVSRAIPEVIRPIGPG